MLRPLSNAAYTMRHVYAYALASRHTGTSRGAIIATDLRARAQTLCCPLFSRSRQRTPPTDLERNRLGAVAALGGLEGARRQRGRHGCVDCFFKAHRSQFLNPVAVFVSATVCHENTQPLEAATSALQAMRNNVSCVSRGRGHVCLRSERQRRAARAARAARIEAAQRSARARRGRRDATVSPPSRLTHPHLTLAHLLEALKLFSALVLCRFLIQFGGQKVTA